MLEAGQHYQGLEIVKPLGNRSTIGNYLAKRLANGAAVRLTILSRDLLAGADERRVFVEALQPLCQLSLTGLADLLEVGEADEQVYYVSEYFPGGNLKQVLGKQLLPGQALRILRDLLVSLEQLHDEGVVHGNVKPGNILLGSDGRPILTDAGITPLLDLDYTLGIDPYYVSPEQVRGASPAAASDVYSLGIALYQMLTGKLPFQADNDFRIAMLRLDEPIPILKDDYAFLQPLLESLLVVDPALRPKADELLQQLEELIVRADSTTFEAQDLPVENGDGLMEEEQGAQESTDMASRIEKTLNEREAQRMKTAPVGIEITDPERKERNSSMFSYLMLLLGVLVGAVVGAAFYLVLPNQGVDRVAPAVPGATAQVSASEADRLLALGKTEQIKKAYLREIAADAASPRGYNNLASIYAAEGDLEQAQALLKQALETSPDYLAIYRNIGTVYAAMARDSYGKALQLEGEQKPVRLQLLGQLVAPVVAAADKPVQKTETVAEAKPEVATPSARQVENEPPVETVAVEKTAVRQVATPAPEPETVKTVEVKDTAPAAEPVQTAGAVVADGAEISAVSPQLFLQRWAKAWSEQDIDLYLASYASDYAPSGYASHQAWADKRKQRIEAPSFIAVEIESLESISGTGDIAELRLVQAYRSDRYQDRTRKSFVLRKQGQGWVITEERSLGRVN